MSTSRAITKGEMVQDARKDYEKTHNGRLIGLEDLNELGYISLFSWLSNLGKYGNKKDYMILLEDERGISVSLFTSDHKYSIRARRPNDNDGYLGCGASTRTPRTGEDWSRGNDLPDGPYNEKTWQEILNGIIGYELQKIESL